MYNIPHLYGADNHLCKTTDESITVCLEECTQKGEYPCDECLFELCCILMTEQGRAPPGDANEAVELYVFLRNNILDNLV